MAGFAGIYSNASSKPFTEDPEYDPNRYQYGGYQGGAAQKQTDLINGENAVQQRAAPQIAGTQLDQTDANQSRGFQMGSLASLQGAADGSAPSQAAILGQQMADRNAAGAVSAAGTVRGGPGAQSSAYRYAAQNAATQGAQAQQSIMADRAGEMATARGQLATAAGTTRGQDLGAASTNAQLGEQTQLANAGYGIQQTGLNDQRASQYEGLQSQVNEDQLNAGLQQQQIQAGVRQSGDALNTQTNQANTQTNKGIFGAVLGAGQGVLSGIGTALSDPASKLPIMGSLANLGIGGKPDDGGVGGGVQLDKSGGMTLQNILNAGTGLGGSQPIKGMVGGGGVTGGTMPSGEGSVTGPAMMSDEETKESSPLLAAVLKSAAGAHPYDRDPEVSKGVAGAPRGYANGRGAPEEDKTSWSSPKTWGMNQPGKPMPSTEGQAPGAADWQRYGADAKKDDVVDWSKGGAVAKPDEKPGVFASILSSIGGAKPFGARDVTTSDPAAKRAAYLSGRSHGAQSVRTNEDVPYSFVPLGKGEELVEPKPGQPEVRSASGQAAPPVHKIDLTQEAPGAVRAVTNGRPDYTASSASAAAAAAQAENAQTADRAGESSKVRKSVQGSPAVVPQTRGQALAQSLMQSDKETKDGFDRVPDDHMADAMRSMQPSVYAYKPEYAGRNGQSAGEVNVGPMANEMAKDPVARTAIVRDPGSGMLAIDKTKAEKVIMGSLASLQHQIDGIGGDVPRASSAKKQRRRAESAQP